MYPILVFTTVQNETHQSHSNTPVQTLNTTLEYGFGRLQDYTYNPLPALPYNVHTHTNVPSFPGPAQLSIGSSTVKHPLYRTGTNESWAGPGNDSKPGFRVPGSLGTRLAPSLVPKIGLETRLPSNTSCKHAKLHNLLSSSWLTPLLLQSPRSRNPTNTQRLKNLPSYTTYPDCKPLV